MDVRNSSSSSGFAFDLDELPNEAQVKLIWMLEPNADDLLNLLRVFPSDELEKVANETKARWAFQKLFPLLLPYLRMNHTLTCRLVCSGWKSAIDHNLANVSLTDPDYAKPLGIPELYNSENYRKHPFGFRYGWNTDNPKDNNRLLRFHREMDAYSGNPFIFRSVEFDGLHNRTYRSHVRRFLARFGGNVWKLLLAGEMPGPRATLLLRDLLQHTPNLRLLSLDFCNCDELLDMEEQEQIQRQLTVSGLPELPQLTCLQVFWGDWQHSSHMLRQFALSRWADQLHQLWIWNADLLQNWDSTLHGGFAQLKLLVLRSSIWEETQDMDSIWVRQRTLLWNLTKWKSPLENITISTDFRMPLGVYLQIFQTFSSTLRCLTLDFEEKEEEQLVTKHLDVGYHDLHFPKLATIHLRYPRPEVSLKELLRIKPGIQTLLITTTKDAHLLPSDPDQLESYIHLICNINICRKIPTMEKVNVEIYANDKKYAKASMRIKPAVKKVDAEHDFNKDKFLGTGLKIHQLLSSALEKAVTTISRCFSPRHRRIFLDEEPEYDSPFCSV